MVIKYKCTETKCSSKFVNKYLLKEHLEKVHRINIKDTSVKKIKIKNTKAGKVYIFLRFSIIWRFFSFVVQQYSDILFNIWYDKKETNESNQSKCSFSVLNYLSVQTAYENKLTTKIKRPPIECGLCGVVLSGTFNFNRHMINQHSGSIKLLIFTALNDNHRLQ